jgi:hypothetical protein
MFKTHCKKQYNLHSVLNLICHKFVKIMQITAKTNHPSMS